MRSPQLYGQRGWTIPNQLAAAVAMAREAYTWVESFPICEHAQYALRLVLEEMLSNTIKYGYSNSAPRTISIRITVNSQHIQIVLVDDANPFDPTDQPRPDIASRIEAGGEGGFGLELVRQSCSSMTYQRAQNQNRLTLEIPSAESDNNEADLVEAREHT